MEEIPRVYIADGHHRFSVFAEISKKLEKFQYFPFIVFSSNSLNFYSF